MISFVAVEEIAELAAVAVAVVMVVVDDGGGGASCPKWTLESDIADIFNTVFVDLSPNPMLIF